MIYIFSLKVSPRDKGHPPTLPSPKLSSWVMVAPQCNNLWPYVGWPLWGQLMCVCVWRSKCGTGDKLCKHPADTNTRACSWYQNVSTCSVCSLSMNYSVYTNLILMASAAIAVLLPVTSCEHALEARPNFRWLRRLYASNSSSKWGHWKSFFFFVHSLPQSKGTMYISRWFFFLTVPL